MRVKSVSTGLLFETKLNSAIQELEKAGKKIVNLHPAEDLTLWAVAYED